MRVLGWILTVISCLFLGVIIFFGRNSVMTATMLLSQNAYLPRFIDKVYLVIFGLIWVVSWIVVEGYYSEGVKRRNLIRRFFQVTGVELVLLFGALILSMIYTSAGTNWAGVALSCLALVAGLGLIVYSKRMNPSTSMNSQAQSAGSR